MKPRGSKEHTTIAIIALAVIIIYLINQPSAEAGMRLGTTSTTSLIPVQSPTTGAAAAGQSQAAKQSPTGHDQKYLEEKWGPKVNAMILGSDKTNPSEVIEDAKKFQDKDLSRYARTKISELAAKSPSITMPGALPAINDFLDGLNPAAKNPRFNEAMANEFKGKIGQGSDFSTPSALSLKGSTITNGKVSIPLEKLSNSKVVALPDGGFMVDGVKLSESAEHLQTSESKGKRAIDAKIGGVSLKINGIDPEAGIEVSPKPAEDIGTGYSIKSKKPVNIETPAFKGTIGKDGEAGGAIADVTKSKNSLETKITGPWAANTKQFIPDQDLQMSGNGKTDFLYEPNEKPKASSTAPITIGRQSFAGKDPKGAPTEVTILFGQVSSISMKNNEAWWMNPINYAAKGLIEVTATDAKGNQALKHQGTDEGTLIGLNEYHISTATPPTINRLTVYHPDPSKTGALAIVSLQDDSHTIEFSRDKEGLKIRPSTTSNEFQAPSGVPLVLSNQGDDSSKYAHAYIKDGRYNPGQIPEAAMRPQPAVPETPTVGPAAAAEPEPEAPPAAREGAGTTRREESPSSDEDEEEGAGQEAGSARSEKKEKPKLPSIPVTDEMRNSKNGAARIYAKLLDYASKIEDPERRAEVLAKIQNGMDKTKEAYQSAPPEVKTSGLAAMQPVSALLAGAIGAAAGYAAGTVAAEQQKTTPPSSSTAYTPPAASTTPASTYSQPASPTPPAMEYTIPEARKSTLADGLVEVPLDDATKFVKYNQLQKGDVIVRDFTTQGYIDAFRHDPSSHSYKALIKPSQFPGGEISEQKMSQWLTDWGGWRVGNKR